MKTPQANQYNYLAIDISEGGETGYEALIPKFPKLFIVGDTPQQLHEAVQVMIKEEIEHYRKKNIPLPKPDKGSNYSGKFMLRVHPNVHEALTHLSMAEGSTLNKYLNKIIENHIGQR